MERLPYTPVRPRGRVEMSLILEALKKAERQHKLGEIPGISAQATDTDAQGRHRLGWVALTLVAASMLGVGLYLGSMQNNSQSQVQLEPSRPPGELTARPVRPLSEKEPPKMGSEPLTQVVQPRPAELSPKPFETLDRSDPVATPVAQVKPPPPRARPLHEMPSGFVSNLPAMNIDIHSFDSRSEKRYVLINMEKYREGDYLAEGPFLVEILPDGVIMEHMGERFILPLDNL
jgi:general secretion pathway protein B